MTKTEARKTLLTAYEQAEKIQELTGRLSPAMTEFIKELEKQVYGKVVSF